MRNRINRLLLVNLEDSRYIVGTKAILEDELHNLTLASGEYERDFILSVIYKNINILETA